MWITTVVATPSRAVDPSVDAATPVRIASHRIASHRIASNAMAMSATLGGASVASSRALSSRGADDRSGTIATECRWRTTTTTTTGRRRVLVLVRAASASSSLPDSQRVVITGAGVVSTAGHDRVSFFESLCSGKSGVIDLQEAFPGVFDDLPTRIGAPVVDLDYGTDLTAKEARRMDKVHQYAICAGKRALRDANLWGEDLEKIDKTRCGVLVGSAMGGMQVYEDNVVALKNKGVKKMSPFTVPYMLTNMSGAILGMQKELGFRGPNYAVNTACATSKCVRSRPRHVASSNSFLSFCRVYSTWCCAGKQPFLFGQSFSFFLPRSLHAARRRR